MLLWGVGGYLRSISNDLSLSLFLDTKQSGSAMCESVRVTQASARTRRLVDPGRALGAWSDPFFFPTAYPLLLSQVFVTAGLSNRADLLILLTHVAFRGLQLGLLLTAEYNCGFRIDLKWAR